MCSENFKQSTENEPIHDRPESIVPSIKVPITSSFKICTVVLSEDRIQTNEIVDFVITIRNSVHAPRSVCLFASGMTTLWTEGEASIVVIYLFNLFI